MVNLILMANIFFFLVKHYNVVMCHIQKLNISHNIFLSTEGLIAANIV